MRIVFLSTTFPHPDDPQGGVFNLQLVRALARTAEVKVISPRSWLSELQRGGLLRELTGQLRHRTLDGIEVRYPRYYYTPKILRRAYGWFLWESIRGTVRDVLSQFSPDLVVAYWAHPDGAAAVRIAHMIGVPSAILVGGSDVRILPSDRARRTKVIEVLKQAEATVAVSRDLKEKVIKLGIDPRKIHVWSQGVDRSLFHPGDRREARRRLSLPLNGKIALWVGRIVAVKGLDVLLRAFAEVHRQLADSRLYLVGAGGLRSALEAQISASGLRGAATVVGSMPNESLPDWYRAADITVLSSHSEGIPNVLREAHACGTPFVATNVGGIPEIAHAGADRLVPAGDSRALAQAMMEVFAAPPDTATSELQSPTWADAAERLLATLQPLIKTL